MPHTIVTDLLLDFCQTGELGDICVGMTCDAVRSTLGDPYDVAVSTDLWLHGDQGNASVQLPFVADRVQGIWVYFFSSTNIDLIPNSLNAASWTINGQLVIDDLTRLLNAHSVHLLLEASDFSLRAPLFI